MNRARTVRSVSGNVRMSAVALTLILATAISVQSLPAQNARKSAQAAPVQNTAEQASLDMWIVQRYRGAQLLPDSGARGTSTVTQAGAPRVESARTPARRDTVVALHFSTALWRPALASASPVQFADPTGAISGIAGRVTARRAFRTPRRAGARDTVKGDWRIGWAYLVAVPARVANAATSGLNGWALIEAQKPTANRTAPPKLATPPETTATIPPQNH